MATKNNVKKVPIKQGRKCVQLGERNVEVRPVGAWVEPEYYDGSTYYEAVVSLITFK